MLTQRHFYSPTDFFRVADSSLAHAPAEQLVAEKEPPVHGFTIAMHKTDVATEGHLSPAKVERGLEFLPNPAVADGTIAIPVEESKYEKEMEILMTIQSESNLGRTFIPIVNSDLFKNIIVATHLINCLQLATLDPRGEEPEWLKTLHVWCDILLYVVFTSEMLLMHLALGCQLYWLDPWNCLDGGVVIVGYFRFLPGVGNVNFVRILRIVRPLRVVGKVQGMRVILQTLQNSFKPLFDAMCLAVLVLCVFGIVGLYIFQGALNQRCYNGDANCDLSNNAADPSLCVLDEATTRLCGSHFKCQDDQRCIVGPSNPNYGHTNFDNILSGLLTIFVAVTLEGWVDVMYMLQDTSGFWTSTIYFHLLIILGSLFTLNLALAVISDSYGRMMDEEVAELTAENEVEEAESDESSDDDDLARIHQENQADVEISVIEQIARSNTFGYIVMLFILLNTIILSVEHASTAEVNGVSQAVDMTDSQKETLLYFNYVFIVVFTVEMIIKLIGIGIQEYVADTFNIFDAVIVVFSFIEIFLSGNSSLSVLRSFRLARVFKLVKSWTSLRKLMEIIWDTLPSVGYLSIVMLFFMFVMSILGMNFFGGKFEPPLLTSTPRINFDNFLVAMLTVFQCLTGENWNDVLYNSMTVTNEWAVLYFLILTIIGNFVLLNLFLAILLSNFSDIEPPDYSYNSIKSSLMEVFGYSSKSSKVAPQATTQKQGMAFATTREFSIASVANAQAEEQTDLQQDDVKILEGNSLMIFSTSNPIRLSLQTVVQQIWFENVILFFIMLSSISLAMDEPILSADSDLKQGLNYAEYVFVSVFAVELVMKVIVHGLLFGADAYLRDLWNLLDAFIVATSLASMTNSANLDFLRILRTFRAMRPLRTIKRAPGLKCVVDAILGCVPSFINIVLVSSLVYLVFAIMGVQLWAGKFWYCNDATMSGVSTCTGTFQLDGVTTNRKWINAPMNFDNVGNGMLTLFEVASLELWLDVMHSAMDAPSEIGIQPTQNKNPWAALYFVWFIIIGCFLFLNLFVSAVVDNFNRTKHEDGRSNTMTDDQENFVQSLKSMLHYTPAEKPTRPRDNRDSPFFPIRISCYNFLQTNWFTGQEVVGEDSPTFDNVIVIAIMTNIFVMCSILWVRPSTFPTEARSEELHALQDSSWNEALETCNLVFAILFAIEGIIKVIGLGMDQYFASYMNIFDFCIIMVSFLGIIFDFYLTTMDPDVRQYVICIRAARVVRIFRLVNRVRGIRRLLETLVYTLPSLCNVVVLLTLILFVFTVLGMSFFGDVPLGQGYYGLYNHHANFRQFHVGIFLLFRMSTGESWNGVMHDVMEVYPQAWIYFTCYMLFGSYLMFNLVIAILLEEFSSAAAQEQHLVTPDMIEEFAIAWGDLDPKATHFITCDVLPMLLKRVSPPLGAGQDADAAAVIQLLKELRVKQFKGTAHFIETFVALVQRAYNIQELDGFVYRQIVVQLVDNFPSIKAIDAVDEHEILQAIAARKMQAVARGHQARKNLKLRREARRRLGGGADAL